MNNFLEFIEKDINAKKTLISTMPTKTKTNIKKFNENLISMEEKYDEYRTNVRNYLLAKSRSFNIKDNDNVQTIEKLKEKIISLGNVKFLLNPSNTYFEKMGFDDLLYQINNYYIFNFNSLNDIINGFLDKFDLAGIKLTEEDFNYTCYVHEYMGSFLEVRNKKTKSYDKVSEIFEQIYWINPEIVEHIELNFRKLIKKNDKKFINYIIKLQKQVLYENKINNYVECLEKLQSAYIELNIANKEDINDIIFLAKQGKIDINQYVDSSKIKLSAYDSLVPDTVSRSDKESMNKIYRALEKLKLNVEEYINYLEFIPLIKDFKEEYQKLIPDDSKKSEYEGLKTVVNQINNKEDELERINRKIFSGKPGLFEFKNDNALKQLKNESIYKAKELYELYKTYDKEYFKDKVLSILTRTLNISDFLNLYYSYDYFKKLAIKRVYGINVYDEILKYSDNFDMFAMDPTNIIINGISIFDDNDVPRVIANKYRLNNIKIAEEDLDEDNLKSLIGKILLILRINAIENSTTTIEKVWFMVQVEKMISKENPQE